MAAVGVTLSGEPLIFVGRQLPAPESLTVHATLGTEQALNQLLLTHLEGEHGHDALAAFPTAPGIVQAPHVSGLEEGGLLVDEEDEAHGAGELPRGQQA